VYGEVLILIRDGGVWRLASIYYLLNIYVLSASLLSSLTDYQVIEKEAVGGSHQRALAATARCSHGWGSAMPEIQTFRQARSWLGWVA